MEPNFDFPVQKWGFFHNFISILILSSIYFTAFLSIIFLQKFDIQSDFPKTNLYSLNFTIPCYVNNSKFNIEIDIHKSVFYTDLWRGHWCPYYNDRNIFMAPRINEILQHSRRFNTPAVFISFAAEASMKHLQQRKIAKLAIRSGNISVIRQFKPQPNLTYDQYNPGFIDSCNYQIKSKFSNYLDYDFHRQILIAKEDLFVSSFEEAAMLFKGYNAKYVFILGEHTNMCLMHVIMYCKQIGILPIVVDDLSDCGWVYNIQHRTLETHSKANEAVLNYLQTNNVPIINSYDLLFKLKSLKGDSHKSHYERNINTAFRFKYYKTKHLNFFQKL